MGVHVLLLSATSNGLGSHVLHNFLIRLNYKVKYLVSAIAGLHGSGPRRASGASLHHSVQLIVIHRVSVRHVLHAVSKDYCPSRRDKNVEGCQKAANTVELAKVGTLPHHDARHPPTYLPYLPINGPTLT